MRSILIKTSPLEYLRHPDFFNLSSAIFLKIIASVCYIILIPFAIEKIGPSKYGVVAFFLTIHGYVTLFDTGITYAVNYLYTKQLALDVKEAEKIHQCSLIIYASLAILVLALTSLFSDKLSMLAFGSLEYRSSFAIFGWILFLSIFDSAMTSVLQAHERLSLISLSRFLLDVVKIAGVVAVSLGWVRPAAIVEFIVVAVASKVGLNFFSFAKLNIKFTLKFDRQIILEILKMSLPAVGISACMLIALLTDKFLISGKISPAVFAAYSVVIDLTSKIYFVYYSLTTVVYPKLIKNKAAGKSVKKLRYIQYGGVVFMCLLYYLPLNIFSKEILSIFIKTDGSIDVLLYLASVNSLLYLTATVGETALNSSAMMKRTFIAHACGVVVYLALLHALFNIFGAVGVLLSIMGMYFSMNIVFLFFQLKLKMLD